MLGDPGQCSLGLKCVGSGVSVLGPDVSFGTYSLCDGRNSTFTSVCLDLSNCKMGMIIEPTSQDYYEDKITHITLLASFLTCGKVSVSNISIICTIVINSGSTSNAWWELETSGL